MNEDTNMNEQNMTEHDLSRQLSEYGDWLERESMNSAAAESNVINIASAANDAAAAAVDPADLVDDGSFVVVASDGSTVVTSGSETAHDAEVHEITFEAPTPIPPRRGPRLQLVAAACLAMLALGLGSLVAFDRLGSEDPTEVVADDGSADFAQSSSDPAVESGAGTLGGADNGDDGSEPTDDAVTESSASSLGSMSDTGATAVEAAELEAAAAAAELDETSRPIPEPIPFPPGSELMSITADGDRFIALERDYGSAEVRAVLVESTDGVNWTPIEGASFPEGMQVYEVKGTNGRFIASGTELIDVDPGRPFPPVNSAMVATSTNAVDWTLADLDIIELDLPDGLMQHSYINGAEVSDEGWLVQVAASVDADYALTGDEAEGYCGLGARGDSVVIYSCDGSEDTVIDAGPDVIDLIDGRGQVVTLTSTDGTNFAPRAVSSSFGPVIAIPFEDDFAVLDLEREILTTPDGEEVRISFSPDFGDQTGISQISSDGATVFATVYSNQAPGLQLARSDDGGQNWARVDLPGLALGEDESFALTSISHGDAGWAVSGEVFEQPPMPDPVPFFMSIDGYTVEFQTNSGQAILRSDDGSFEKTYDRWGGPDGGDSDVRNGFFGTLFLLDPDSGEPLVRIPIQQLMEAENEAMFGGDQIPFPVGPPSAEFTVDVDGYTVFGDISTGPIRLRHPDGREVEFADEWSFYNQDTSDGIEIETSGQDVTSSYRGPEFFTFHENGEEILRVRFEDLWNNVVYAESAIPNAAEVPVPDRIDEPIVPFSFDGEGESEGLVLIGEFPIGQIELVDVASGQVVNSWDADEDFDPLIHEDIVELGDGASFKFLETVGSDRGVVLEITVLLEDMGIAGGDFPPEVPEGEFPMTPPDFRSFVFFSPDGADWQTLTEFEGFGGQVVVGDDEVIVQRFSENGPSTERIPIGQ